MKSSLRIFFISIVIGALAAFLVLYNYLNVYPERNAPEGGVYETFTIDHNNIERTYDLYIPKYFKENSGAFFVLHGSYGKSEDMRIATGYDFEYLAEKNGFLVVYPQGYKNFWNDCRASADYAANQENIDDVGFLKEVIQKISLDYKVDKKKIIATGISNGGQMIYRLAYEAPRSIFVLAPLVATIPIDDNNECKKENEGVNILIFNGTKDPIAPYDGGQVELFGNTSRGIVQSSEKTYEYWKSLSPTGREMVSQIEDADGDKSNGVVKKINAGENVVALYTLINGGHIYASPNVKYSSFFGGNVRDISTAEEIFKIFEELSD